jgi:hypothetical protein
MQKVSLYIRNHSTRRYEKVEPKAIYPTGTIYVLRYAGKWETLPTGTVFAAATAAKMQKEIALFTGREVKPAPKPKSGNSTLDELIDVYLTTGRPAEKNWRKHTLQCYRLALKLFRQSCTKTYLHSRSRALPIRPRSTRCDDPAAWPSIPA